MSRPPLRTALDSGWLLQVAFVIALVEVALRLALGSIVHPFLYLLTPPVAAVLGFGYVAPGVRTRMLGDRRRYAVDAPDGVLVRLLAVAVVGHAVAVVAGVAAFVLLDTPLQAALSWRGVGLDSRQPLAALAWPVVGVAAGTALAWTLPALVATAVSEGLSLRRAVVSILDVDRRPVAALAGLHLLGVGAVVTAVALAYPVALVARSLRLFLALAGGLTVLLVTVPLALAAFGHLGVGRELLSGESATGTGERPTPDVPVGRLAVVAVLVVSLVTLAGAVRMAELRPMDHPSDALGESPDEMYATALENTLSGSYMAEWVTESGTDAETRLTWQVDREDRQLTWELPGAVGYISTGAQSAPSVSRAEYLLREALVDDADAATERRAHTPPNYARWARNPADRIVLDPPPELSGLERVSTAGDEITLELTDHRRVLALVAPTADPGRLDSVETARVRAVIDRESRRLVEITVQFEGMLGTDDRIDADERYTFEYGTDIERPDGTGSAGVEAHVWRLLLY